MKIACVVLGTRGDVQPIIALANGLYKQGHEIICAPPENEELISRVNCRFLSFGLADKLKHSNGTELTIQLIEREFLNQTSC